MSSENSVSGVDSKLDFRLEQNNGDRLSGELQVSIAGARQTGRGGTECCSQSLQAQSDWALHKVCAGMVLSMEESAAALGETGHRSAAPPKKEAPALDALTHYIRVQPESVLNRSPPKGRLPAVS